MSETLVVNEIYLSLQGESTFAGLPCIFVRLTACNLRCSYCDTAYAFTAGKKQSLPDILVEIRRQAKPFGRGSGEGLLAESVGGAGVSESPSPSPRPSPLGRGGDKVVGFSSDSVLSGAAPSSALRATSPPVGAKEGVGRTEVAGLIGSGVLKLPLVELTGGEPLLQPNALPLMRALCDEGFTVLVETSGAHDISKVDARVRRIMDLKCPSSGEVSRNRWENIPHLKATDEIKFVMGTEEDYAWAKEKIAEHQLAAICPLLFSWVQPLLPEQQEKSLKKVPAGQTPISRLALAERIIADALPVRFQVQLHKIIWSPDQRGV